MLLLNHGANSEDEFIDLVKQWIKVNSCFLLQITEEDKDIVYPHPNSNILHFPKRSTIQRLSGGLYVETNLKRLLSVYQHRLSKAEAQSKLLVMSIPSDVNRESSSLIHPTLFTNIQSYLLPPITTSLLRKIEALY